MTRLEPGASRRLERLSAAVISNTGGPGTCSAGKPRVYRRKGPLLQLGRRHMRVKLCTRCPYTPRDLAGHYDTEGQFHACAKCDGQDASTHHYPREAHRRPKCATASNILGTALPSVARSVTESLVSSGTTPGEPHSVQRSVLIATSSVRKATANGCVDFTPPDNGCGENHAATSRSSGFRSKEAAH